MLPFRERLAREKIALTRERITTLQINVGKLCNQACLHCHVEAGPKRTEIMTAKTADRLLELLAAPNSVDTLDITGGAPELCPEFRRLVQASRALNRGVIDRCNLTVFFEKGQQDLPQFLAEHQVRVIASLPCYSEGNVDKQRGRGVFGQSIQALQILNELGYGKGNLVLDLVYNPQGPSLPPSQENLEKEYKARLKADFGITFNQLFCITNMPIKRFHQDLVRSHRLDSYMELLFQNFNVAAAEGVMCKSLVSVGWDGQISDCDFNQMLEMRANHGARTIFDLRSLSDLEAVPVAVADHCYGCTAGAGSSCTGTLN